MAGQADRRTALVTGANSGVGLELAKRLLGEGWEVAALIRSGIPAGEPGLEQARAEGRLRVYTADLSDFASMRRTLHEISMRETLIDVLFNNAAISLGGLKSSPQGRDLHFEVNTVAPFITLMELKPLLARGALKTVVNTSSNALLFVKQFDLELLERPRAYKPLSGPYGASKLGLSLWSQQIAPGLLAEGIEIRSVNPGANKTKMTAGPGMPKWLIPLRNLFFSHPSVGAARVYDVALGPWRGKTGVFVDGGKATPFKFGQLAPRVLERVHTIYAGEFLRS